MGFKSSTRSHYDAVVHPEKMDAGQLSRTRWTLVIGAIVLVAGAILLGVLNNQNQQPGAGPAPVPTYVYTPGAGDPGTCLDNTAKDITTTAPAVERWEAKASGQIPVIKGAGPCGKPIGGVDTGFANTQTGALTAAYSWTWQLFTAPVNASTPDAIRAVTVAGPDSDGLVSKAQRVLSGAQAPDKDLRSISRIAGYKIQMQGDTALVDLAAVVQVGTDEIKGTTRITLRWVNNDWKVVPVSADDFARGTKVTELSGFTPFSSEVPNASR